MAKGVPVVVYDPAAMENARRHLGAGVTFAASLQECATKAHVLAITTPWDEFRKESFDTDVAALAASMLPDLPNTFAENASARFFRESSRTLLEAIYHKVPEHQTDRIFQVLSLSREELRQTLAETPAEPLIDPGAHEQGAGIVATAAGAVRQLAQGARHRRPGGDSRQAAVHLSVRRLAGTAARDNA